MSNKALSKMKKPFTPIMRRFLQDVFMKPSNNTLGKRLRGCDEEDIENIPPIQTGLPEQQTLKQTHDYPSPMHTKNCLALQNEDTEEDAVVITALSAAPFCCHADLLTMSRAQLVDVATALNARLPLALRIDTSEHRPDGVLRNAIEVLVGIRRDVPPAPKANKLAQDLEVASLESSGAFADTSSASLLLSSPATAAAARKRTASALGAAANANGTPRLAALRELEEDTEREGQRSPSYRPMKRRRIAEQPGLIPARVAPSIRPRAMAGGGAVTRSQSHRIAPLPQRVPATSGRVLRPRSQSQRLPADMRFAAANRFVTTTRGSGWLGGGSAGAQGAIMTSTPNARAVRAAARAAAFELSLSESSLSEDASATSSTSSSPGLDFTPRVLRVRDWLNRSNRESGEETSKVASRIQAISMGSESAASMSGSMDMNAD